MEVGCLILVVLIVVVALFLGFAEGDRSKKSTFDVIAYLGEAAILVVGTLATVGLAIISLFFG